MENNFNINPNDVGANVEKTTTYLKKLSDYIERKIYDKDGNLKEGGVKSLSLSFAMLVGFSMAILIVSSMAIMFIMTTKNETINQTKKELEKERLKLEKSDTKVILWQERYNNVYSQCDSIGFARARAALEFSESIKYDVDATKTSLNKDVSLKTKEAKELNKLNNEVKAIHGN